MHNSVFCITFFFPFVLPSLFQIRLRLLCIAVVVKLNWEQGKYLPLPVTQSILSSPSSISQLRAKGRHLAWKKKREGVLSYRDEQSLLEHTRENVREEHP